MLKDETLRERVTALLKRSHDSHRLLQKVAFGRGQADDLLSLASTVYATQELAQTLLQGSAADDCVQGLVARIQLDGPSALAFHISEAIDEDGISQQHEIDNGEAGAVQALAEEIITSDGSKDDSGILKAGRKSPKKSASIRDYYSDENQAWIMRPAASATLQRLHQDLLELNTEKQTLASNLSNSLGVTSLTLRFTPGLGHICHIKGKDMKRDLPGMKNVSSSKSTRSFHHPEWTYLGQRIDQCKSHIRSEEQRVFNSLREQVIANIIKLRRNAAVLDELDVACSFATLAAEKGWTRPILNQTSNHRIVGGRHPTVESGLKQDGRTFVSNDCTVGETQRTWLITGPNMAGKSTFLRQNALITILAQAGSYVPADYTELGIVDQIFTRVGSADSLHQDQSTFMVEMLETATILKNATSRSFVIMDEIGRGTTPEDGIAVAFACLHHLYNVNKSRTLFATHFHALADMIVEGEMEGVGFYCTDVEESGEGEGFRYVHKLRQGVNRQSHALKVARLAGLPREAIEVARKVLDRGLEESV
jgi:DNA mismatch repair ATPase MutS